MGSSNTAAATLDERANHCFGCGAENPRGLQLVFTVANEEQPVATASVRLNEFYEGPPGYVHGGIIATLLDEAMSKLNRPLNILAVTRHMEVDYLHPVPLEKDLTLTGRHLRREGRKLFHQAEISLPNGTVLARGTAIFIEMDRALLNRIGMKQPEA
ncbi:MAG TPA: PaaI family thioesterase [Edaphobacter sp.]|jgi:uncharacterized protein (TIGR00369 family)|nr:PaaI family thioesterase [Edaphobacter sp.]